MSVTQPSVSLESGDHLSRDEFHRRYCLRPDIKKAELVEGVVFVSSPVRFTHHSRPQRLIASWLDAYTAPRPGMEHAMEATVYLSADSEVQPDALLFVVPPPAPDGAKVREDGYIEGAPQLIVEISASSASVDLHNKRRAYERAGVPEYIVWRTTEQVVDWFRLREGKYERVEPDAHGVIESETFPGLRLNIGRLLAGDRTGVLAELGAP